MAARSQPQPVTRVVEDDRQVEVSEGSQRTDYKLLETQEIILRIKSKKLPREEEAEAVTELEHRNRREAAMNRAAESKEAEEQLYDAPRLWQVLTRGTRDKLFEDVSRHFYSAGELKIGKKE